MAHEIHTTKGFIISSEISAEADKVFFIFTEDLGLVRATAQGVRKISSKLRYALQDFSYSEFSFVMTKGGWRITNATSLASSHEIARSEMKVKSLRLLKRLCGHDEPNPDLFCELVSAFRFIDEVQPYGVSSGIEALLVLKILHMLGYWGELEGETFATSPFTQEVINLVVSKQSAVIDRVNKSLRATQLL